MENTQIFVSELRNHWLIRIMVKALPKYVVIKEKA